MGAGSVRQTCLEIAMKRAENSGTTPNGKTLVPAGIPHPLLPKGFVLEDDNAAQAFELYLGKAESEMVYTDFIFWQSPKVAHSANDARQAIAKYFVPAWPTYEFDCYYPDGQNMVCDEVHVLGAALIYEKGSELDFHNHDGNGISVSEVETANHVRWEL